MTRYYQLLARPNPTDEQTAEIAEIKDQLEGRRLLGDTQREQILLEVIDQYLAERRAAGEPQLDLPEETKQELVNMWRNIPLDDDPADA